jgi:predicted hotdog family 3-hydroxylacyl-ACP dehydratase
MFPDIETLIPHRAPMRWIDALTDHTETTANATTCFRADHFAVNNGFALESALVECIAQTVAAALGWRTATSGPTGAPANGMLVSVSNFRIHAQPPLDKTLNIEVRQLKRLGPMLLVTGQISHDGKTIAEGQLMLYA